MKFALRALCLVVLALTGCDDEPTQRRAFIDFLQEHIVSRPGVHLVLMKPEMAKSFGPYASHYQLILDFNADFDLSALEKVAHLKGQVSDLSDLVAHREELRALRQSAPQMIATVDQKIAAINAARAALQQPPDLKEVYDKAFNRLVTRPATLLKKMLELLPSSLDAMLELADYVAKNAKDIRVQGMDGTSEDPVVARHVHELAEAIHQNDAATDDLKRQFQALLNGT
jgi:Protein of unknown function (DUF3053)